MYNVQCVEDRLTLMVIYGSIIIYLRGISIMKILFVCTGNICRSAMAHHYMQKKVNDLNIAEEYIIESAGTNAYTGESATDFAIQAMKKYNADLSKHRSTYIEEVDVRQSDLIICMTVSHKKRVLSKYPNVENKVYTLKEYIGEKEYLDIDDPWGFGIDVYTSCAKEIVYCVDKLIEKILRGG